MLPLKIGLAGYMGAGKSSCIKFLEMPSLLSLNADQIAKSLMNQSTEIKQELIKTFGEKVCVENAIDFVYLGSIVFDSHQALKLLNAIVHPPLLAQLHHLITSPRASVIQLVLLDAALIPLWNIEPWFDMLLWVDAPAEVRLERLIGRSQGAVKRTDLMKRMVEQESLFEKSSGYAWIDIINNGSEGDLKSKCTQIKAMLQAKVTSSSQHQP